MRTLRKLLLGSTIPLGLMAVAHAQETGVLRAPIEAAPLPAASSYDEAALASVPTSGPMADRVRAFVSARAEGVAPSDLVLSSQRVGKTGRVHQRFEQVVGGRRVWGSHVQASFDQDGRMVRLQERASRFSSRTVRPASISAEAALDAALARSFPSAPRPRVASKEGVVTSFAEDAAFFAAPKVEEVLIGAALGRPAVAYLVETWNAETNELHHTLVGPTGEVINVEDRTANDSYRVFREHPGAEGQVIVQGPGGGNAQSPNGWLGPVAQSRFLIQGWNAFAYLDVDNNNAPDAGGASVTNGQFTTTANLSGDPSTTQNKEVAVQNLFWLTNLIHDTLYDHGFDEQAGNFQEDNFGRGGAGSDGVYAEAQDGSGVNNANFATPSDGSNPRMQMYIWDRTNPRRDGDLDSDIVWHEYGHGLTWRMIGSMSGPISGAIGEGMSDVLAILQNGDDAVGEWALNDSRGIRSARYTNYPRTIGDFTATSVHFDGEIYAAAIWRLRELFLGNGRSVDELMDLLVEGMNFTAPAPDYRDMRDGILDAGSSAQDCLVWQAFAAFGMGDGFSMPVSSGRITINESTAVPSSCTGGGAFPDPNAFYTLRNLSTGGYLDTDSNGRVDQNATANESDKVWRFVSAGNGRWRIVNAFSGRGALDTQNNGVVQWLSSEAPTGDDKLWTVTQGPNSSYRFDSVRSGRGYLEASGSSTVRYNTGSATNAAAWVPARVN
jgi:hypothetical protein